MIIINQEISWKDLQKIQTAESKKFINRKKDEFIRYEKIFNKCFHQNKKNN